MDKLSAALSQFSASAGLFYAGELCGTNAFGAGNLDVGHLHLLKQGKAELQFGDSHSQVVQGPAVIFFPGPRFHQLSAGAADDQGSTRLVCAHIQYGAGARNPVTGSLPEVLIVGRDEVSGLARVVEILVDEAFNERDARVAMVNRLMEMVVISLIRHVIEKRIVDRGMLAGLAHPHLCKVILAIHGAPQRNWSVGELADLAAMSRSKFSKLFHDWVGMPAGEYVQSWRITIAQQYLSLGKPVDWVAGAVGYETSSAFARMFRKKTGCSPKAWLKTLELT